MPRKPKTILRRAIRVDQDDLQTVFLFTLLLDELLAVADVSRVAGSSLEDVVNSNRSDVREAIDQLAATAKTSDAPLPFPITLALSSQVRFRQSRGIAVDDGAGLAGTLELPVGEPETKRSALIVDGHILALAALRADLGKLALPVFGFICDDELVVRSQFQRINTLPRMTANQANVVIPEVLVSLSQKLSAKEVPEAVVNWLNESERSPFYGIVKGARTSQPKQKPIVPLSLLVRMVDESLSTPSGCLFPYRNIATGKTDFDGICRVLILFWSGVKNVFPDAWGKSPNKSRLMHGVGIRAMGRLMDRVMPTIAIDGKKSQKEVEVEIRKIQHYCRWTSGTWDELDLNWNEIQNVPRHIHMLSNCLIRAYFHTDSVK